MRVLEAGIGRRETLKFLAGAALAPRFPQMEPFVGSEQHKALKESIQDRIPDEELAEHNIFIHPTMDSDLVLRRSVLGDWEIFKFLYAQPEAKLDLGLIETAWLEFDGVSTLPEELQAAYISDITSLKKMGSSFIGETYHNADKALDYRIFWAVGGYRTPSPSMSFISPDQVVRWTSEEVAHPDPSKLVQGQYLPLDTRFSVGFTLRHGLMHFLSRKELVTDQAAYRSLAESYNRQLQGDDKGYPFVALNTQGLTYL